MSHLKVRIVLNKGRHGAPLAKLGKISEQAERFLRTLAGDLGVESKQNEWLAANFQNGSIEYDAEFAGDVNLGLSERFARNLEFLSDFDPEIGGLNGVVSDAAALEYGKIGSLIDPDEVVGLGIYPAHGGAIKWRQITYQRAARIRREIETPLVAFGAVQGLVHAWFKEAREPSFLIREFSTEALVRVFYTPEFYPQVARAVQERTTTVIVSGDIHFDRTSRQAQDMRMAKLDLVGMVSSAEFEKLFGIAPQFQVLEDDDEEDERGMKPNG